MVGDQDAERVDQKYGLDRGACAPDWWMLGDYQVVLDERRDDARRASVVQRKMTVGEDSPSGRAAIRKARTCPTCGRPSLGLPVQDLFCRRPRKRSRGFCVYCEAKKIKRNRITCPDPSENPDFSPEVERMAIEIRTKGWVDQSGVFHPPWSDEEARYRQVQKPLGVPRELLGQSNSLRQKPLVAHKF